MTFWTGVTSWTTAAASAKNKTHFMAHSEGGVKVHASKPAAKSLVANAVRVALHEALTNFTLRHDFSHKLESCTEDVLRFGNNIWQFLGCGLARIAHCN